MNWKIYRWCLWCFLKLQHTSLPKLHGFSRPKLSEPPHLGFLWRLHYTGPTPVLLPGKSHGQRSLVGCSPWDHEELDKTEELHFQFSLSCIGEGNGNPLQCSCLENPRDGGAWWAAISGVTVRHNWSDLTTTAASHRYSWLNHCLLVIDSISRPSSLPRDWAAGTEISNSLIRWFIPNP